MGNLPSVYVGEKEFGYIEEVAKRFDLTSYQTLNLMIRQFQLVDEGIYELKRATEPLKASPEND